MLNIVIPMAGAGSRFVQGGFVDPKPLISLHGIPMIRWVISNLTPKKIHRFIFICQKKHADSYELRDKLKTWSPGCEIVEIEGVTQGAACSVMAARDLIDNDDQLMIANSDQFIEIDVNEYIDKLSTKSVDGLIMTMSASDPKWSFVSIRGDGLVGEVFEKKVISNEATTGIYNFKKGNDFVRAASQMIAKGLSVNGEFYVAPTYNQLISGGARIGYFNIGEDGLGFHGLGIPSDLDKFLNNQISIEYAKKTWK